jgi:alkylated DNA nucleotide flippase Atl1
VHAGIDLGIGRPNAKHCFGGSSKNIAYWRVINTNGGLIARFPGGAAGQAALLVEEGSTIDTKGKISKVKNFRESLVRFD